MPVLQFKGKSFVENHHLTVKYHQLIPNENASLTDKVSLQDNLIIHGDNLIALKALLPQYRGKVKCIYIDPPYNTGVEEWRYSDNVNSPMIQEWVNINQPVDAEDLTRHDKWLCMMMPRLILLHELLQDNGIIFISIGDDEIHHLRMLMDEIFGEDNFVATFVRKRRTTSALAELMVSVDHEYILAYQSGKFEGFLGIPKDYKNYSNPDNDPKGNWTTGDLTVGMTKDQRPNQYYVLEDKNTGIQYQPNPNRVWSYIPESMEKLIEEDRILFPDDPNRRPMLKRYKSDLKSTVNPVSTWIQTASDASEGEENVSVIESGLNTEGTREIQDIFGTKVFDYPKPTSLVKSLIKYTTSDSDIILDSFAGSGTTGHAVLQANQDDFGSRKFILIEMENYADALTAERIRRISKNEFETTFSFFELGDPITENDILSGKEMPSYVDFARYLFYTSTGEEFKPEFVAEDKYFIVGQLHQNEIICNEEKKS